MVTNSFVADFKTNLILNKYLREIRHKEVKPNTKGTYSYCYMFSNHVVLKNISKIDFTPEVIDRLVKAFNEKQTLIHSLKQKFDINTPDIFAYYKGAHHFYQMQERAKGTILSVFYPSTARAITFKTGVLDNNDSAEALASEDKIQPYERDAIGRAMAIYNIAMQKQLKEANVDVYKKFVKDFKTLIENGVSIDVTRSENFLFDKKTGFWFVDLAKQSEGYSVPSDFDISKMIFSAFADFKTYIHFMNAKQATTILKNMDTINLKLYKAIKENRFDLTPEQDKAIFMQSKASEKAIENLGMLTK